MSTTLSATAEDRTHHPPPPAERTARPVRRTGPLDRVALRLGLLLITWSRRTRRTRRTREELRRLHELRLEAEARRRADERLLLLLRPWR